MAERLIKGVLRRRSLLDALLRHAADVHSVKFDPAKTPKTNLWILRLAMYERLFQESAPDYAVGAEAVALARAMKGEPAARFVNAMVRRLFPAVPADAATLERDPWFQASPLDVQLSIPPEIIREYESAYRGDFENVLRALGTEEAVTWLRVNTLRADVESVRKKLETDGISTEVAPRGLSSLRWTSGPAPWSTSLWDRGLLVVQDLAAQLAAPLLTPASDETVIDLCAAPGGKTGHLWELMQGQGRLIACEIDPSRRKLLHENLRRLYGRHGIDIPDFENLDQLVERLGMGVCDKLLIDAPCQAMGLIRRHPEIRWDKRLRGQSAMAASQQALLRAGARLVRPGGLLLWVTCSPTLAENELLIDTFLAENARWKKEPIHFSAKLRPALAMNQFTWRTRPDIFAWDAFAFTLLRNSA